MQWVKFRRSLNWLAINGSDFTVSVKKAEIVGIIYFGSQFVMVPVDTADLGLETYHGDSEDDDSDGLDG